MYKEDFEIFQIRRIEILKMLGNEYKPNILKRVDLDDLFKKLNEDIHTSIQQFEKFVQCLKVREKSKTSIEHKL